MTIIAVEASSHPNSKANWWRQAVVYQIYPRSFADADGDGIGDLEGVISRVNYLKRLGVDAVWLSPFYPSALADGGYDVDDYRDVDPRLGTLNDFDHLVDALHAAGIRLIIDIVPNHTSDRHEWFREALASPRGSVARERYLFRDGRGKHGKLPPSDWVSLFGGPAWEPVGDGQWYHHFFAKEQPDLNWSDQSVRQDFLHTLRFWSDRGVDGFRVDVAHGLVKDLPKGRLPSQAEMDALPWNGAHPMWDRDEVHEVYAEWRGVFDEYDPPRIGIAEAMVPHPERRARYACADGLGQAFNFDLLEADFDAHQFREIVTRNVALTTESQSSMTWVLSNHDVVRHATRYGLPNRGSNEKGGASWLLSGGTNPVLDAKRGERRARAASLFVLGLPGSTYLYQGEELGLHEVANIPASARQDPSFFRNAGNDMGRDGCRVPLPWSSTGPSLGFGSALPHLPQPPWFAERSVELQSVDPTSTLNMYRHALHLRAELQTSDESLQWVDTHNADVLHFHREGRWSVIINFGREPVALPAGRILLASSPVDRTFLPGETAVWLDRQSNEEGRDRV